MYYAFYKTTDVFAAEELFIARGIAIEIVPTPVQDKAYCGICIRIFEQKAVIAQIISTLEYNIID